MFTSSSRIAAIAGALAAFASSAMAQEPPTTEPRFRYRVVQAEREANEKPSSSPYYIGLSLDELSDQLKAQLNIERGVVIAEVLPDSPAAKAELKRHDILLKVGESDVNAPQDVLKVVSEAQDKELQIVLLRAGKEIKVAVTPAKRPMTEQPAAEGDRGRLEGRLRWTSPRGEGQDQLFFFHPGVLMGKGALKFGDLPEEINISITKSGKEPARIVVKKGDQTFEVAENKLSDLPGEVREVVERFLAGGIPERMALRFHAQPGGQPVPVLPPTPGSAESQEAIKKAHEEVAKAQERLQEQIRKWQSAQPRPLTARVQEHDGQLDRKLGEVLNELKELRKEVDALKKK